MPAFPKNPPRTGRPRPGRPPDEEKNPKRAKYVDRSQRNKPSAPFLPRDAPGQRPLPRPKLPPRLGGQNPHEKGYTVVGKPG